MPDSIRSFRSKRSRYWFWIAVIVGWIFVVPVMVFAEGMWQEIGPSGGVVVALKSFPDQPEIMLAAVANGGLYRSTDRAGSWAYAIEEAAYDVAIAEGGLAYAATQGGVYRSRDYGQSWEVVFDDRAKQVVLHDSIVFVHLDAEKSRRLSRDSGATWQEWKWESTVSVSIGIQRGIGDKRYSFMFHSDGSVYRTEAYALFQTLGADWNQWRRVFPEQEEHYLCFPYLSEYSAIDSVFYMYSRRTDYGIRGGCGGGISVTRDFGQTWNSVRNIPSTTALAETDSLLFAGGEDGEIFIIGKHNLESYSVGDMGSEIRAIDIARWDEGEMIVATPAGILKSTDYGQTWTKSDSGIRHCPTSGIQAVRQGDSGIRLVADLSGGGTYTSDDNGNSWQLRNMSMSIHPGKMEKAPSDPNILYTGGHKFSHSWNMGEDWTTIKYLTCNGAEYIHNYGGWGETTDISVDPRNANHVIYHFYDHADDYDTGIHYVDGTFNVSEGDSTWVFMSRLWGDERPCYVSSQFDTIRQWIWISRMEDYSNEFGLFAVDWDSLRVQKTIPLDSGWEGFTWQVVGDLIVIFFHSDGIVKVSTDLGQTWSSTDIRSDLTAYYRARSRGQLTFSPDLQKLFLIMPGNGVLASPDSGLTWHRMDAGLATEVVYQIDFSPQNPNIAYIATDNGIYRRDITTLDVEEEPGLQAVQFALLPNYPNPFNASTKIVYRLDRAETMRLFVTDITGREVRVLVDRRQQAGEYRLDFDGMGLSSGIYILSLEAADRRQARKMLLLK